MPGVAMPSVAMPGVGIGRHGRRGRAGHTWCMAVVVVMGVIVPTRHSNDPRLAAALNSMGLSAMVSRQRQVG